MASQKEHTEEVPTILIDTLIDKIILFDDKIDIFYKYSQNNNPDDLTKEIRRDFCLPSKRQLSVTYRHIIYTGDFGAREIIC